MTLNDLKTGMIVTTRSNDRYLIVDDPNHGLSAGDKVAINFLGWVDLRKYNAEMKHKSSREFDIVKVEKCVNNFHVLDGISSNMHCELIWKETVIKKLTVSEIEKLLGYKVEIVSEEE